jgi:hypothetical protein
MFVTRDVSQLSGWLNTDAYRNIAYMVVTLEMSQLEISALKPFKFWMRPLMSVMAETSQSAIRPYVAVAAVGLPLNAWTAVSREALLVKGQVPGAQLEPP